VCLPLGQGLAAILPTKNFNTFGYIWSLNPGPFSIKEHVCISVMVGSTQWWGLFKLCHTHTTFFLWPSHPHGFPNPACPWDPTSWILPGWASSSVCCLAFQYDLASVLANCAFFNTLHKNYSKHDQGKITQKHSFGLSWLVVFCGAGFLVTSSQD
jgi:hypothetical protein